ncbi:MAG: hypothetical protein ABJH68_15920 [Ilumatobacter sp.]|uniref:hypothetical protein n=1 Tax=Ilumatobacter sp. TaxID=1967498 RepID=UPI0032995490
MRRSGHRQDSRSWKLSASLLGLVALVLAGISVSRFDLGPTRNIAAFVAIVLLTVLVGTVFLVPRRSSSRPPVDQ